MAYAENTTIPVEKSMNEINALIKKRGAERIGRVEEPNKFTVIFFLNDRMLKFCISAPSWTDIDAHDEGNYRDIERPRDLRERLAEKVLMQRARALLLVIKAKFESIDSNVETFDEAFLPNIVMSDGATVMERTREPLALEYQSGKPMPMLLEGPNG